MIIRKMRHIVLLVLVTSVSARGATVTLMFRQHATQNLFQTSAAVAEQISAFSLAFNQDISALSLFANVDYSAFHRTGGLSSFAADLGLDYLVPAGTKSAFYFAAGGAGAFYGQEYEAFRTLGGSLTGAFKTYLAPSSILKVQWQGLYASYADSLFDFLSHAALLSIDKYFPTRTTLKADAEYGYKHFLHPFVPLPAQEGNANSGSTTWTDRPFRRVLSPSVIIARVVDDDGTKTSGTARIIFNPNGSCSTGQVLLGSATNGYRVSLTPTTGRVQTNQGWS